MSEFDGLLDDDDRPEVLASEARDWFRGGESREKAVSDVALRFGCSKGQAVQLIRHKAASLGFISRDSIRQRRR